MLAMARRSAKPPAIGPHSRFKITPGFVLSEDRKGNVLNRYRRHKPPLDVLLNHGLPQALHDAGKRYGDLWRRAWHDRSPPHSDTTRVVVDGGSVTPIEPSLGSTGAQRELDVIERDVLGSRWARKLLDLVCGREQTLRSVAWMLNPEFPGGLHRRKAKRVLRQSLERLARHWRSDRRS